MDIKKNIGERIKEIRTAKKLSQIDLAYEANIERSFITHIESGKRNISINTLEKVLVALDISFHEFFATVKFKSKSK